MGDGLKIVQSLVVQVLEHSFVQAAFVETIVERFQIFYNACSTFCMESLIGRMDL